MTLLTHPFTHPIPLSLPAIAAGVLGGGCPRQFTPDMCFSPYRGGPHDFDGPSYLMPCSSCIKGRSCVFYFSQSEWVSDGLVCGCMLSPWTLLESGAGPGLLIRSPKGVFFVLFSPWSGHVLASSCHGVGHGCAALPSSVELDRAWVDAGGGPFAGAHRPLRCRGPLGMHGLCWPAKWLASSKCRWSP
jgi:hypothetical protein